MNDATANKILEQLIFIANNLQPINKQLEALTHAVHAKR